MLKEQKVPITQGTVCSCFYPFLFGDGPERIVPLLKCDRIVPLVKGTEGPLYRVSQKKVTL